jgi:hypothetical protein
MRNFAASHILIGMKLINGICDRQTDETKGITCSK